MDADPRRQDPRHQDPRRQDPRRQDPQYGQDSPWTRTQRLSRPEAAGWQPEVPASASYQPHPSGPGRDETHPGRYEDADVYDQYEDEDRHDTGHRFVPGFGDQDDRDDHDDWQYADEPGRRTGRTRRGPKGRPPKPPRRRRFRWLAPLFALVVILIPLAVGGYYAFHLYMERYHPADYSGPGTGEVVVQVASGDTATSLGPKLTELGVVASARAFVLAAEHSSDTGGLVPGFYKLHEHMKASLAYAVLLNPKNLVQITVTIPEGWRLSQIVAWLGTKSGLASSAYDQVLRDPAQLHLPAYAKGNPEGYLFPATYEVLPHETALGVLTGMVQRFDQEAASLNLAAAARQVHLSEDQVIIMASLVQAEGGRVSDYPKIARVIYNRLAQNIPLQLDSTVLYGLKTYGIIASDQQLNSTSPYNTYKYKGLTPGPIDSPGASAIEAVLHPAPGNWLYFVTVNPKTGLTLFTASESQFEQYRAELEHNLGQG
ncbi:MAG: endolytic transglycosylase MltG [Streptosporangiaceae bacterium]